MSQGHQWQFGGVQHTHGDRWSYPSRNTRLSLTPACDRTMAMLMVSTAPRKQKVKFFKGKKKVYPGLLNWELLRKLMNQTHVWGWASRGSITAGSLCSYPLPVAVRMDHSQTDKRGDKSLVWPGMAVLTQGCTTWLLSLGAGHTRVSDTNFIHFPVLISSENENQLKIHHRCETGRGWTSPTALPTALEKSSHFPPLQPRRKTNLYQCLHS